MDATEKESGLRETIIQLYLNFGSNLLSNCSTKQWNVWDQKIEEEGALTRFAARQRQMPLLSHSLIPLPPQKPSHSCNFRITVIYVSIWI